METTLVTNTGRVKRVVKNGVNWLVSNATIIVPGVLPGSDGNLYYPPDETARAAKAWNGTPITIGHPKNDKGNYISARSDGVKHVGYTHNSAYNGKLRVQTWFQEDLLDKTPDGIVLKDKLLRNERIEVSTGLHTDKDPTPGIDANTGREYAKVARNHRPDHLAVLLHEPGACSLDDGCGLNVNSKGKTMTTVNACSGAKDGGMCDGCRKKVKKVVRMVRNNCGVGPGGFQHGNSCTGGGGGGSGKSGSGPSDLNQHTKHAESLTAAADSKKGPQSKEAHKTAADAHRQASISYFGAGNTDAAAYHNNMWAYHDKKASGMKAKKPIHGKPTTNSSGEPTVDKTELVTYLTANCACWKGQETTLNGMTVDQLKVIKAGAEKPVATTTPVPAASPQEIPTANTGTPAPAKRMTSEEFLAVAPPEFIAMVNNAKEVEQAERVRLSNILVANVADEVARKAAYVAYIKLPLPDLRTMAAAAQNAAPPIANADLAAGLLPFGQRTFVGQGGGSPTGSVRPTVNRKAVMPLPGQAPVVTDDAAKKN